MASKGTSPNGRLVRSAVERYEGPLVQYAMRFLGEVERARDVVQETFLRLCEQEASRVEGHLAEWLYTVCRNRALDVVRKESRMASWNENRAVACESRESPPPEAAERKESVSSLLEALGTLPQNQQEVIRLKFQHNLSYRQISRVTGLSVSNVGFLLHTGLKTIRHRLTGEFAGSGLNGVESGAQSEPRA